MSGDVSLLKTFLRASARDYLEPVRPPRDGQQVHLEVWRTREKSRFVGIELGHDNLVNLWLEKRHVPNPLPASIEVTLKEPKGRGWTDAAGKGANSNLSAYSAFVGKRIARLAILSVDDAQFVMGALHR